MTLIPTKRLRIFVSWLTGFMAGAYPVGGLVPLALLGFQWRSWTRDLTLLFLLGILAMTRTIWHVRMGQFPLLGLADVSFMWLIYQGQRWIRKNYPIMQTRAILWGLFFTVVWSILQAISAPLSWIATNRVMIQTPSKELTILLPINSLDASVQSILGTHGSGSFHFSVQVRATRAWVLRIALYHPKLPFGGKEVMCQVQTTWVTCSIDAILPTRASIVLDIGGKQTWKTKNGKLELRNLTVASTNNFAILDFLSNLSRVSAWAFNPNALGAGVVAVAVVASWSGVVTTLPMLLLAGLVVWLSGSRAALVTLVISSALLLFRTRVAGWILFLTLVLTTTIFSLGRFTSTFDPSAETTQQRSVAFSNAFHAFQSTPLFGIGDFEAYEPQRLAKLNHAHNLFLQTLAESGFLGLLPVLGLWVLAFTRAFKQRSTRATVVLAVVLSLNLVDYLFYFSPLQFAFWWAFSETERPVDQSKPTHDSNLDSH
jgi:hypothetical protein